MNSIAQQRDLAVDLGLVDQLRTLVTAIISRLIGYEGPITKHNVDEKAKEKLRRLEFGDALEKLNDRKIYREYKEALRAIEEPQYWQPKETPPEKDSRYYVAKG